MAGPVRRLRGGRHHREQLPAMPGPDDVEQVAGYQLGEAHLHLACRCRSDNHVLRRTVRRPRADQELPSLCGDDGAGHAADAGPDALGETSRRRGGVGRAVPDDDLITAAQRGGGRARAQPGNGAGGDGEELGAARSVEHDDVLPYLRDHPGSHGPRDGGPV